MPAVPTEPHGGRKWPCRAGVTSVALLVSGRLRFQSLPQASGLQGFPGFSAQMNSLGEPPRATRHLALPCGGQATLGKITRVYVSSDLLLEILWMGQWVLPGTGGCSGFCPHRYPKVPGHLAWTYQASPLNNLSTSEARGGPLDSVCAS